MELLDYDDAAGWAPMLAEVTASTRMPPWFADPRHGRWKNERRLTETEKKTLELFAAQGARSVRRSTSGRSCQVARARNRQASSFPNAPDD